MRPTAALALIAVLAAGCAMFSTAPPRIHEGPRTVVILYDPTDFKDAVVSTVAGALADRGYEVVADRPANAPYYPAASFGAVVYMAEYWAWHVPINQKRYLDANDSAANIVMVTTSGDPDVTITEPFDAITSASTDDRAPGVASEILDRLSRILP